MSRLLSHLKSRWWDEQGEPYGGEGVIGLHIHTPWPRRVARYVRKEYKWIIGTAIAIAALVMTAHSI